MKPATDSPPTVPDHTLLRPIGKGNYGVVWLGANVLGSLRAIKVVDRRTFLAQRPYDREYAGIMKYEPLSRGHPGLVSVLHVGHHPTDQYFYYIMELADDAEHGRKLQPDRYRPRTLRDDLTRLGQLPVGECLRVGLVLAAALGYLHRHGLVHRDIKPSNIIFVDNEPKFADIGLVEDIGEGNTFLGTEGYTPPEGPGKPTADLYGLGKVLYEMCTGLDQVRFPELPPAFEQLPDARARLRLFEVTRKTCELIPRRRFQSAADLIQALQQVRESPTARDAMASATAPAPASPTPRHVMVVGDLTSGRLPECVRLLEDHALGEGVQVFIDRPGATTVEWARRIETELSQADVVVALLTPASLQSEMLAYELQLAQSEAQQHGGRPCIEPILIGLPDPPPPELAGLIGTARSHTWPAPHEPQEGLRLIRNALESLHDAMRNQEPLRLREPGGAVPLDSAFYLQRPADELLRAAIASEESIVLIRGARQMGKTSLLARGLQHAREQGMRVVHVDYQQFNSASFESLEALYFALGNALADALDLDVLPEDCWDSRRPSNTNFERYVRREVLTKLNTHLVWGMDEVDRLLPTPFGSEVFGLFRSWHNQRALDPTGPWSRLTQLMVYATEAHLFISDLNQSPFNVGVRIHLEDFNPDQVGELNRLYGSPLANPADLARLIDLVGGQPYLVCRSLHELATRHLSFDAFTAEAVRPDGVFGDHLRRIVFLVAKDTLLVDALRSLLRTNAMPRAEAHHRLRAAGVLADSQDGQVRPRCRLYGEFLRAQL